MAALTVRLRHDVEEEGLDVVVERLVVEEEFGEQAQVLAVDLRQSRRRAKHDYCTIRNARDSG